MCQTIQLEGGVTAIVCGVRRQKLGPCKFCRHAQATRLCDYELAKGKTCDAPMCEQCATRVGPDRDLCPKHVSGADSHPPATQQLPLDGFGAPDAQARLVLAGASGPWAPSELQRELLRILLFHQGARRAVTLNDLIGKTVRENFGHKKAATEREIKDAFRSLVVDFKVRIGASRTDPCGYYLITSGEEARSTAQPYIAEIKNLAARVRVILDPHDLAEFEGQLLLKEKEAQP